MLSLVAAAPASAQKTPVFRVGLDLVNVTVTVRDGAGGLVSDLAVEDFVVREDGRPQKLEVFAPAALPEEREELALNLGMLFDTSESMRKDLRLSQESAIRFLDAIPRARDLLLIFFDRDIRLSRYSSENQQGIFERILETEGAGLHRAPRRDRRVPLARGRHAGAQGAGPLLRRRRHDEPGAAAGGAAARPARATSRSTRSPSRASTRRNSSEALRARAFLHSLAELQRRPRLPADRVQGAGRASTSPSSTSWARSTSSGTSRTTRPTTASSARSPSS